MSVAEVHAGGPGPVHEGATMADLFVLAAARHGQRVAMVDDTGEVTYRELAERVARAAEVLGAHGVARGRGVAQLARNTVDAWVVQMATYVLGARFVGLHALASLDDLAYVLADSGAETLVVDEVRHPGKGRSLLARVPSVATLLTHGRADGAVDLWGEAATTTPGALRPRARSADLARLAYTGGTTGPPKGVMLPHRSLVTNTLMTMAETPWPRDVRFVTAAPITHGAGSFVLPVLLRGGAVILLDGFAPDRFIAAVERHRATATMLVPTMLYALLDHPATQRADLASLELLVYGASPSSPTRLEEALARFGPILMQAYGQTEAPNSVTILRPTEHAVGSPRLASIGSPYAGNQVTLLDDDGQPVPTGQPGEICVRGPLVMDGYWHRPEETAAAFAHGWLHTGDVAYADEDGYLFIVDRKKEMIVTGGFNVFSREVEDVLMTHPAVAVAAVIGVPDDRWGEAVKAIVVPRAGQRIDAAALIALVRDRKGPVQAPKTVDVVDEIPTTAVGKPDKRALRARYWGGEARGVH